MSNGMAVFVGNGVAVGASVGGIGVAVGIAACVSATMVIAAAMAVPCTSAALMVGSAGDPQAVNTSASIAIVIKLCFIELLFSREKFYYFVSYQKEGGCGVTPHPDLLKRYLTLLL